MGTEAGQSTLAGVFRRNIVQSIGSSGAGLALTLITTPLMTRVFPAEAYGVNGIVMTAATLLSAFGLFGLPVALARAQTATEQSRLINASAQFAVMLVVVCALCVGVLFILIPRLPSGFSLAVLALFPFLVLAHATQRIVGGLVTARGLFPPQAAARIGDAIANRVGTLSTGWLIYAGPVVMMLGDMLGKALHMAIVTKGGGLHPVWKTLNWRPELASLSSTLKEYKDFALYSNLASAMPLLLALGLQLFIGWRLDIAEAGQYVLAQSILVLPVSVIAMATAPVLFHRMVKTATDNPNQLKPLVLKASATYVFTGALLMLPVALFGPTIFVFAFGQSWTAAGAAAAFLCLPQILAFSLTALISTFRVTHKIKAWLVFELSGLGLVMAGLLLAPPGATFMELIGRISLLMFLYQSWMHLGCFWAIRPAPKSLSQST